MRLRVVLGEPVEVAERTGDGERVVRSLRREVEGAIHELLEEELARRARFPYGRDVRGTTGALA
jgi:hypothetical protein